VSRIIAVMLLSLAALFGYSAISAASAHADDFIICPSGLSGVATSATSCPFADNVRAAYFGQGGGLVYAYSPVTNRIYAMYCITGYVAHFTNGAPARVSVNCYGGDNGTAEVVIW
jgi:hypothetical protein